MSHTRDGWSPTCNIIKKMYPKRNQRALDLNHFLSSLYNENKSQKNLSLSLDRKSTWRWHTGSEAKKSDLRLDTCHTCNTRLIDWLIDWNFEPEVRFDPNFMTLRINYATWRSNLISALSCLVSRVLYLGHVNKTFSTMRPVLSLFLCLKSAGSLSSSKMWMFSSLKFYSICV